MVGYQLALVVIAAVLAGAALPVLLQWRSTLAGVERAVRGSEPELRRALAELADLAARLNRCTRELDGGARQLRALLDALAQLTDGARSVGGSLRTVALLAAAAAPAVSAALRALQAEEAPAATPSAGPEVSRPREAPPDLGGGPAPRSPPPP